MRLVRGLPVVSVRVNGEGPFDFVVDTGAGTPIVVSKRLAQRLRLPSYGVIRVLSQGRFTEARRVGVSEVGLGELDLGPAGGVIQDLTAFRPLIGEGYEGLIGFPLFRRLRLTFDYPARRLEVGRAGDQYPDGRRILSYELLDETPVLAVVVDTVKGGQAMRWQVPLTIDSGSSFGLVLPERLHDRLGWLTPATRGPSSLGVTGRVDHRRALLAGALQIGEHELPRPAVIFGKGYIGLLGGEILRRFRVTFDSVRLTVGFELPRQR